MADKVRELVEKYGSYVKAIVVNKAGSVASKEDIEDCISDVFFELCRSPETLPASPEELKYLVASVAKRRAIDCFRRLSYRTGNCIDPENNDISHIPDNSDVEKEVDKRAVQIALWEAVRSLGEPDSHIIIYTYFYRKKAHEIARQLSMSTAAVQKRCQRAQKKLKEMLLQQGYEDLL